MTGETAATGAAGVGPGGSGPLRAATLDWWAYDRPATYEVTTETVDVPARDGVTLGCTLVRPVTADGTAAGPFPGLVVELTPYVAMADLNLREATYFASRGYVAITGNVRGAGRSGGPWQHCYWAQDGIDAADIVEWLAAQPFCDGRVGQYGESYGGQTSYGAAVERPPHLRAIAPMQAPASLYHEVIYPGGIKSTEGGVIDCWPPIAELITGGAVDAADEFAANRAHPTFDDYWLDRSLVGRYDDIEVPVLAAGGWNDSFFRLGALTNIEGALDRTWAIYGPWPHLPPFEIAEGFAVPDPLPAGVVLAWFDHWVMELAAVPIPSEPTFVSFEGPAGVGLGWRELDGWDPRGRDPVTLVLGPDATLTPGSEPGGPATFHQPSEPTDPDGSVTFTTPPLTEDRVLLGRATLDLDVSLSAAEAHLYVELLDVDADGGELVVNDGFLAASHHSSHTDPTPVPPNERIRLHVDVLPAHHRFVAGHTVRLRISGGGHDRLTAPPEPVVVAVATGTSTIRLPGFAAEAGATAPGAPTAATEEAPAP